MASSISSIKRQLKSVRSTQKITNAMALVATAKLQKQKNRLAENHDYSHAYLNMILTALSAHHDGEEDNVYFVEKNFDNPLHIIITSNSGLCGSYNQDLLKYVQSHIGSQDPIFAIGDYGIEWLDANDYMVVKRFSDLEEINPAILSVLIDNVVELYKNNEISSLNIIYTEYINTLTYSPTMFKLLPLDVSRAFEKKEIEMWPDRNEVFDWLVPMYVSAVVYDTFLEAKTSEHAARRSAMDSANKNAQNLIEGIILSYNQARQASITQEVNEITAGADAL